MSSFINCPKCQTRISADGSSPGEKIRCPVCSATFRMGSVTVAKPAEDPRIRPGPKRKKKKKAKPAPMSGRALAGIVAGSTALILIGVALVFFFAKGRGKNVDGQAGDSDVTAVVD